jgi:hypothetical protein
VRLAAELIGAEIDIKSESDVKDEVADALAKMLQVGMAEEAGDDGASVLGGLGDAIDALEADAESGEDNFMDALSRAFQDSEEAEEKSDGDGDSDEAAASGSGDLLSGLEDLIAEAEANEDQAENEEE